MKLNLIPLAALLALAAPALASDAATETAQPAPEKPKKVCRMVAITGSNFPRRVCMTAELWKEIEAKRNAESENALARKGAMGAGSDRN